MSSVNICITYRDYQSKADGSCQAVLRVTIQRKIKYFPLGFDVLPHDFDAKSQIVKKSDLLHYDKNMIITAATSKALAIKKHFLFAEKEPSSEEFLSMYLGDGRNPESFYSFAELLMKRKSREFADSTISFYKKHLGKMKKFKPVLTMGEIDLDFLYSYRDYCFSLGNNEATMFKSLEFIRRVLNAAIKEDRLAKSPFRNFQIKNQRGSTEYLYIEELAQLEKLYLNSILFKGEQNVLRFFLFACYSGLRYSDIFNLRFNNLITNDGATWLQFTQQKTKKPSMIPLIHQAIALVPDKGFENQPVFRVVSNQTTNRHLKAIANKLGWEKRITFHVARNTFSNLLYRLGVSVEIRAMIVGDTPQVLRAHYTNTDADMIRKAMDVYSNAISNKIDINDLDKPKQ